jgi:ATP adenylyltransferase
VTECLACELTAGERELPGGCIRETSHWRVEHCVGPLGAGTLIVKPKRHVLHVADLNDEEAAEVGPLLQQASRVVSELTHPDQVYVTLWSHGPVHIHWVVQPVTAEQVEEAGVYGPRLQVKMFDLAEPPDPVEAAAFADLARAYWPGAS